METGETDRRAGAPRRRRMDPDGKRAAILMAAERHFASAGYEGAAMAAIAAEAGVAVGSVYRLFPDKPALLAALHEAMEREFIAAMQAGWASNDEYGGKLDAMVAGLMAEAKTQSARLPLYQLTRSLIGAADYVPGRLTIAAIETQYAQAVRDRAFHPHDVHAAASIAYGMVEGGMRALHAAPRRRAQITADLQALFRRAFLV